MPAAERPLRLAEFDTLFAEAVVSVEREGDTTRLRLSGAEGLRDRVLDLTRRESRCCSFFDFSVEGDDQDLDLVISVPKQHHDVLAALTERAVRVSS